MPPDKNEMMPGGGTPESVRLNDGAGTFFIGLLFLDTGSFHYAIGKMQSCKVTLPSYCKV